MKISQLNELSAKNNISSMCCRLFETISKLILQDMFLPNNTQVIVIITTNSTYSFNNTFDNRINRLEHVKFTNSFVRTTTSFVVKHNFNVNNNTSSLWKCLHLHLAISSEILRACTCTLRVTCARVKLIRNPPFYLQQTNKPHVIYIIHPRPKASPYHVCV